MAGPDALTTDNPALAHQAEILARPPTQAWHMANAIRALAIDAVEAAKSGHPGMPMGMADVATALWTRFLKFDAADPRWPDRDRFVLSAGHGSMLLYALLYLTGHEGMGDRRDQALPPARIPRPPAIRNTASTPRIETTTGPLGQGFATAVGMALAERLLAARFGRSLVDHRTWVIASDGDLMEGISHEAAAHRRPSVPVQADRAVRRQPHLDRRRHRAGLLGRRAEAVLRLRLGGQAGRRPRPAADQRGAVLRDALEEADR